MARPWQLRVALAIVTWLLVELVAFMGLRVLWATRRLKYSPLATSSLRGEQRDLLERLVAGESDYIAHTPTLGWTVKPHGVSESYRANAVGLRGDREYALVPTPDVTRIAAFGDSFTHGDDVGNHEVWTAMLEAAAPRIEVLNFGVPGYGLDQAFLRWREEGIGYRPTVVLIGYMSENIARDVNVYRPFYTAATRLPLAKPRFLASGESLLLLPNPAPSLGQYRELLDDPLAVLERFGEHDYYFAHSPHVSLVDISRVVRLVKLTLHELLDGPSGPLRHGVYNETSEAYLVTRLLFDRFVADVRASGAAPIIVVFPERDDFQKRARGDPITYGALLRYFADRRYDYVDTLEAFPDCRAGCQLDAIIAAHFSPAGNRVIADYLANALRQRGLIGR